MIDRSVPSGFPIRDHMTRQFLDLFLSIPDDKHTSKWSYLRSTTTLVGLYLHLLSPTAKSIRSGKETYRKALDTRHDIVFAL